MKELFQKRSNLSNLFKEARMPRMAGGETPQEVEQPRKLPPDVNLGKKDERITQRSLDEFEQLERKDEAENTLKDSAKTEKMVNFMLRMLTDKGVEELRSLGIKDKVGTIAKLAQDPQLHDLFVDCAIAREHGNDDARREAASALVSALAQNDVLDQAFVAQLEKTTKAGKPTMVAGGKTRR